MADGVLHQKGANGLIAEYECAHALNLSLASAGFAVVESTAHLASERDDAVRRVANELSDAQVARAISQGQALAAHIFDAVSEDPSRLGLPDIGPEQLRGSEVLVRSVGSATNSGSSADMSLEFTNEDRLLVVPISLKAYGRRPVSLGSKGARASLARIFMDEQKVSDREFLDRFGEPAAAFIAQLNDFKAAAREFYDSDAGQAFVREYQARKGLPATAKVNNPLRRAEVGRYFAETRGFISEHRFAELYVKMFRTGMGGLATADESQWQSFLRGLRFVLGMDADILTLNAVADDKSGKVLFVENSFMSDQYATIRKVLRPGCEVDLANKLGSSVVNVVMSFDGLHVTALSLAVWKDATIQFKLSNQGDT